MKKLIAILLMVSMSAALFGCGNKDAGTGENAGQENEQNAAAVEVKDALEVLTTVWADFYEEGTPDEEKMYIAGGGYENMTMDAPGAVDPADTDSLTGLLSFPADSVDMIDDAASMMHAMNANTFTAGVYHLVDAADQQALADSLKESIKNTQWMCGFPEVLVIASINDDYVVTAIGNTDIVETFKTKLTEQYGAVVLSEESLM